MKNSSIILVPGEEVTLTTRNIIDEERLIPTIYKELQNDVNPGDRILLDDGLMELEFIASTTEEVKAPAKTGAS